MVLNEEENEYDKKGMQANKFRRNHCATQNDAINATAIVKTMQYLREMQW